MLTASHRVKDFDFVSLEEIGLFQLGADDDLQVFGYGHLKGVHLKLLEQLDQA
jgi:hypothetical protein